MAPERRNRLLLLLHRYNGWNLVFLVVSGLILYLPPLRSATAGARVALKEAHIASGLLMVAFALAYLPFTAAHWRRLGPRVGQRVNVLWQAVLVAGWAVSGLVLWQHRALPVAWAGPALFVHDLLTWLVIPWIAVHAATRYWRRRFLLPRAWGGARPRVVALAVERRAWLGTLAGGVAAAAWGAAAWRVAALGPNGVVAALHTIATRPVDAVARTASASTAPAAESTGVPAPSRSAAAAASTSSAVPPVTPQPTAPQPPYTVGNPPMPVPSVPLVGGGRRGTFRVYTVTGGWPAFDPRLWRFRASGLVDRPLHLDWSAFLALPRAAQVSAFHCVTGWSLTNVSWEGVRLSTLLDALGVRDGADHVRFHSNDGAYTDDLPMEVARSPDVLLAYLLDGKPLPLELGGPLRLVVPRMYGYKSVKWLGALEVVTGATVGYWEARGYPADAWVRA